VPNTSHVELLTAKDAEQRMRRAAAGLFRAGLTEGDLVAFCLSGSTDLLCTIVGAARSRLLPAVLNPGLTALEQEAALAQLGARLVISSEAQLQLLFGDTERELAPYPLTKPMHFTSGTTGVAKAVTTGFFDEHTAKLVVDDEQAVWGFEPGDRLLMCSPVHHTVGVRLPIVALCQGADVLLSKSFAASEALGALRSLRPTTAFMVPTHLQRLLALSELGKEEKFTSLRFLIHAGSSCPPALKYAAMARVGGQGIVEFYGATETQFTFCTEQEWLEHPGTVGKAREGRTLCIEAIDGQVGTIWCDVPDFARFQYFGNEAATAEAWRGNSCTVGDLGELDDDGFLYLTGRRHDLIITGGVNVYPAEIEAALTGTTGVRELCVFSVDDETWGQKVCCAVVGDSGAVAKLRERAFQVLAPFKRPKEYFELPELPMTATGKVLRRALPELFGSSR
jgi:acyl-CoA synthetase (AMP-forming)/AMP-acid ligase II